MPFILVTAGFFNSFAAVFLEELDLRSTIGSFPPGGLSLVLTVLGLVLAGMAAFYAMFVVAPRELADPEDSGPRWVIRFALFVASSVLGIGWLGLFGF